MKTASVVVLLSAWTGIASGQSMLSGRVLGGDSAVVVAAQVQLFDSTGALRGEAMSDSTGEFRLRIVRSALPARFAVNVRRIGYVPIEGIGVRVGNAEQVSVWIRLYQAPVEIMPITVVARRRYRRGPADEFYERADAIRRGSLGHAIGYETLQKMPGASALDAVVQVPSVHYTTMNVQGRSIETVTMRGGCIPAVYLDRLRIDSETLNRLDPTELEGIVIYSGAMEVPAEYRNDTDCGVIVAYSSHPTRAGRGLTIPGILIGSAFILMLIFT